MLKPGIEQASKNYFNLGAFMASCAALNCYVGVVTLNASNFGLPSKSCNNTIATCKNITLSKFIATVTKLAFMLVFGKLNGSFFKNFYHFEHSAYLNGGSLSIQPILNK